MLPLHKTFCQSKYVRYTLHLHIQRILYIPDDIAKGNHLHAALKVPSGYIRVSRARVGLEGTELAAGNQ